MKKYLYLLLLMVGLSTTAYSQAIHVFHDNLATADVYLNAEIDSIRIKMVEGEPNKYDYLLYTTTGEVRYDASKVDSIKFNLPHLKFVHHKGKCQIPNEDHIYFKEMAYSSDDQSLKMRLPDGTEFEGSTLSHSSSYGHHLHVQLINTKELYETREGPSEEVWYAFGGEMSDSITVELTGKPLFQNKWHEIGVSSEANEYKLYPLVDNVKLNSPWVTDWENEGTDWEYDWADWDYDSDGNIVIKFKENESYEKSRELRINPHAEIITCVYPMGRFVQATKFKHSAEEHMNALKDFYNSTNIKDLNTNWFSDEPLWKWDFTVNQALGNDFCWLINDHVLNLHTGGYGYQITGTLPPSFEVFLDDAYGNGEVELGDCALHGTIPQNLKNNPHWNEYGWNFLPQSVWLGGGFDLEGSSNLFLDDCEIEDFVNDQTTTVYDVLAKNKLTWVFNGGAVDMIDGISDQRVNKYLDYKDKGFGLVVTVGGIWNVPYDNYKNYVDQEQKENGLPEEIMWTKSFDKADIGPYGSMSLINDKGELVWYRSRDYDMDDSYYLDQIDELCRQYFGEPTDHPTYTSHVYESTDFSRDGEVMVLQRASVGKGIDLVFTGDQFVDKDMVEGGAFDNQVNEAMECFFSVEPYTSLRDRFNVYAIKAVSLNDYRGSAHVFNNNDEKVLEYVSNIPDVDMNNVTVSVIRYDPNYQFFVSGYASLLENGASITYIEQGNACDILVHEAGGHGFGKLIDEYIFDEAVDNKVNEEELDGFKEFIKSYYHDRGWGMNVSTTDIAEEVPWSSFLNDSRYENEVGIYQGAWLYPYDLWRPTETSVMRETNILDFNAPSREAIYKRIMNLSEGEDWTYDYETFVAFDQQTRQNANPAASNAGASQKTVMHKMPKLRNIVNGKIEDIQTPFSNINEQSVSAPSQATPQKKIASQKAGSPQNKEMDNSRKRDRVLIQGGHVMTDW